MNENLSIPEHRLAEIIMVLRMGLHGLETSKLISQDTKTYLIQWCEEEEEYLKELESDV